MKKIILIFIVVFTISSSFAQWNNETSSGEFEEPFNYSSTQKGNTRLTLLANSQYKMLPIVLLEGPYFCEQEATVTFSFLVKGEYIRYEILGNLTDDKGCYLFSNNIWTTSFLNDFKKAEKCSIMVEAENCENQYFSFNFNGSTAAYNFVTK